jgi:ecdysteroid kinase
LFNQVITSPDQINTEWLTAVLTRAYALDNGAVESFTSETNERELSTNIRLKLNYSAGAGGDMPRNLFLKMVNTDRGDEFFDSSEVDYYIRDYIGVQGLPIPRSDDAAYSETLGRYHILMDDLSETHVPSYAKTPTLEHGLALAEGLAAMHAHWWGRQRLETAGEPIPSAEAIKRFVAVAEPGAGHIIEACADQLEAHWPDAIRELYEKHPPLMIERTGDGNGFTLIHGDTNLTNILVPMVGECPIYVLDRQPFDWSLTTWLGVYDLAYPMVLGWDVEIRRRFEKPILEHYHKQLLKHGVSGYSWEQLFYDYRLSAVIGVYVATEWCRGGINQNRFWMVLLRKAMTAFDDLECQKLWQKVPSR